MLPRSLLLSILGVAFMFVALVVAQPTPAQASSGCSWNYQGGGESYAEGYCQVDHESQAKLTLSLPDYLTRLVVYRCSIDDFGDIWFDGTKIAGRGNSGEPHETNCSIDTQSSSRSHQVDLYVRDKGGAGWQATMWFKFYRSGPPPTVSVTANGSDGSATVAYGGSATIAWSSTNNPSSCSASGNFPSNGGVGGSGSTTVSGITQQQTFTVTCSSPWGSASDSVTVTPGAQPTASVTANGADASTTVAYGSPVTIAWSAANITSCTGSGSFSPNGPLNASGSTTIASVTSNLSFTVSCSNGFVTATDTVAVTVGPKPALTGISPGIGLVGSQTTISGTTLPASGSTVTFISSTNVATPVTNVTATNGTTMPVTVPTTLTAGTYTVTVTHTTLGAITSSQPLTFTVTDPSAPIVCLPSDAGKQVTDDFESFTDGATKDFGWTVVNYPNTSATIKSGAGKSGKGLVLVDTNNSQGYLGQVHAVRQFKAKDQGTIAFDLKPSQTTGRFAMILDGQKGGLSYVYLSPTGTFERYNTTTNSYTQIGTATYKANEWMQVTIDWDSATKTAKWTVNGTAISAQPLPYDYPQNAAPATSFQLVTTSSFAAAPSVGTFAVDNVIYPGCVGLAMTVNPVSGVVPLSVLAIASNVPKDAILTWDFGDGSEKESGTPVTVKHLYQKVGTFTLKLTTGDFALTQPIVTTESTAPTPPPTPPAPTPGAFTLTLTPTSGNRPLEVIGKVTGGTDTEQLHWDFGDGNKRDTAGNDSVKHTYTNPGTYTVTVTQGAKQSKGTVTVTGEPEPPIIKITRLASTGESLVFNLTIAGLLSLITTYFLFSRRPLLTR